MIRKLLLLSAVLLAAAWHPAAARPLVEITVVDRDSGQALPEYAARGEALEGERERAFLQVPLARVVCAAPPPKPTRTPAAPVRIRCRAAVYVAQPPTMTGTSSS